MVTFQNQNFAKCVTIPPEIPDQSLRIFKKISRFYSLEN